jgi:uncharacterized protein (DUF486 family)
VPKFLLVPAAIALSGVFMATAWLAHLKYRDSVGFFTALLVSWAIVLPEYSLNVWATRSGIGTFTGLQMAAMHLCAGTVCMALTSRLVLGEPLVPSRLAGLALIATGAVLALRKG